MRSLHTALLTVALLVAPQAQAQTLQQFSDGQRDFSWSAAKTSAPIVEYTLHHAMLADPDPQPLLRVYGDGRVHVHIPVYMKRAGDYDMQLDPQALGSLLSDLARDGLIDFDFAALARQKQQAETVRRLTGDTLRSVSDATFTQVIVRLDGYRPAPGAPAVSQLDRHQVWMNLEQDARRYQQIGIVQRAANGARRLHDLMQHPALRKR